MEAKKQIQAEALGGMTKADIEARKKAGYVKASAPPEKGGLGLSSYDIAQKKRKKRLKDIKVDESTEDDEADRKRQASLLSKVPEGGLPRLMAKSATQDPSEKYNRIMDRAKKLQARGHRTVVSRVANSPAGKVARAGKVAGAVGYGIGTVGKNIVRGLADLAEE